MKFLRDWRLVAAVFIIIPACIVLIKLFKYNYKIENVIPQKGYKLTLSINTKNQRPESISIKTFAPVNNSKQKISKEQGISDSFSFSLSNEDVNRRIAWQSNRIFDIDGRMLDYKKIRKHVADIIMGVYSLGTQDKALVEIRLFPHEFFRKFYPRGLADFRLLIFKKKPVMVCFDYRRAGRTEKPTCTRAASGWV
jgi:hypothetical protein